MTTFKRDSELASLLVDLIKGISIDQVDGEPWNESMYVKDALYILRQLADRIKGLTEQDKNADS